MASTLRKLQETDEIGTKTCNGMFANTEKMRNILHQTDVIHDNLEQTGNLVQDMQDGGLISKIVGKKKYKTTREQVPEDPEAR